MNGKYQVSNLGNVRSLNYNNTGKTQNLKQKLNRYGYYEVKLSKNNKAKGFLVSTLVAKAFIPNRANKPKVMHLTKNKQNNRADNLKWAYISEIKFDMYKKGCRKVGVPSDNTISYKGKRYKNFDEMAKDYGKEPRLFYKRINRGWTLEEALEIEKQEQHKGSFGYLYKYYDDLLTIKQLAKKYNKDEKLIRKRLSRGWNIYEAIKIEKGV